MTPDLIFSMVGIFTAVAVGLSAAGMMWLQRTAPEARRLRTLTHPAGSGLVMDTPRLTDSPDPALAKLSRLMPKSPKEMSQLQRRLARAGYPHTRSAVYFSVAEIVCPLVLGVVVLLTFGLSDGWLLAGLAALVGYFVPSMWLGYKTGLRQKQIRNGLP